MRSPSMEIVAPRRPRWQALLLATGTLLVLITLLGAALRLYRLGAQSLWLDEVITATAGDGQGAFAFTIPKGTDAIVVWLRATGTGRAEFGPITVYQVS